MKVIEIDAQFEVIPRRFNLDPTMYASVSHLDLSFNRITSLAGLDVYFNLETLILDNNCLTDELTLPPLQNLRVLSLNKNYIRNLDRLLQTVQRATPDLAYLSLLNNPACPTEMENSSFTPEDYTRYRLHVIKSLPKLRFLDSHAVTRRELNAATGRPVPTGPLDLEMIEELFPTKIWTKGLPRSGQSASSRYGKLARDYRGKNSEGNRFIKNHDL